MAYSQPILRANAAFDGPAMGTRFSTLMIVANQAYGSEDSFSLADEAVKAGQPHNGDVSNSLDYDVSLHRQLFNLKVSKGTA